MKKISFFTLVLMFCLLSCKKDNSKMLDNPIVVNENVLAFDENGEFVVVQITDTHQFAVDNGEIQDDLKPIVKRFFVEAFQRENADLFVLSGDVIACTNNSIDSCCDISVYTLKMIADLFEAHNQHWIMTFGNHDDQCSTLKQSMNDALSDYKYYIGNEINSSYYKYYFDEDNARYNYQILIYNNSKTEEKYSIYIFDTGSKHSTLAENQSGNQFEYILDNQADWYETTAQYPSLLFTHIPFLEVEESYEQAGAIAGSYHYFHLSDKRSKIFDSMMRRNDVRGCFFGHEHFNSLTLYYNDYQHLYGDRKMLFGMTPHCGGHEIYYSSTEGNLSGRRFVLNENGDFKTQVFTWNGAANTPWISYENGIID